MFLDKFIHFGENLGDQVKDRSPKKVKSSIEVPYVALLKVQVLSFNMNLVSSPLRVPRSSYPFRGKIGRLGILSFTEKAKIVIEVLYVSNLKVHVVSFSVILISSP